MARAWSRNVAVGERGTASVELIAVIPFLLLALLVVLGAIVVGIVVMTHK
jgi:hypothetical protein